MHVIPYIHMYIMYFMYCQEVFYNKLKKILLHVLTNVESKNMHELNAFLRVHAHRTK